MRQQRDSQTRWFHTASAVALAVLLLVVAVAQAAPDGAANAAADPRLASWSMYWQKFTNMIFNTFNSRTRMIQLATIGMVIGLFIMFRATSKHS